MKILLTALLCLVIISTQAQRFYDTVITDGRGQAANVSFCIPAIYSSLTTADSLGFFGFCVGAGEATTDSTLMRLNGPMQYMQQGWDGSVPRNGKVYNPIFATIQISSQFPQPAWIIPILNSILARYRIKSNSIVMSGISAGGYASNQLVFYQPTAGDFTWPSKIKGVINVEGVKPDDTYGSTPTYPGGATVYANHGGHEIGFEQFAHDGRDINTIITTMNAAVAGRATYIPTNYGGGTHGYWNYEFGGFLSSFNGGDNTNQVPQLYTLDGVNQTIYQWAVGIMDTAHIYYSAVITNPLCFAGNRQKLVNPTSTTTLVGTANGTNGATIASTIWSTATTLPGITPVISSPNTLTTNISGLTQTGNYVFRLLVTDNHGLKDTSWVQVHVVNGANALAKRNIIVNPTGSNEIYYPNASASLGVRPGDTLQVVAGGTNNDIIFGNLLGAPGQPIVIMGPATGQVFSSIIRFDDHCEYVKVINNPANPLTYGFLFSTMGFGLVNNFDVSGVDVNGLPIAGQGATGLICKKHIDTLADGSIVAESINMGYLMDHIHFHNMRVRHSDGEGWYIGPTAPNGGDGQGPNGFYPVRLFAVEIDHNITDSTGWDGIQLSGALDSCSIHDNIVTHYGLINMGSQQAGIIAGGTSNTNVYNNTVKNGTGNGIEIFSYATTFVHDNILDSCGRDGTSRGQESIFQNDIPSIVDSFAKQKVYYYNNTIQHPQTAGAIRSNNDRGTALPDSIYNNLFCIPGGVAGTWQSLYLICNPLPTLTGNVLITTCGVILPTVSASPLTQTIIIPTANAFVTGAAAGNGGATITSTTWTISGSATVISPHNLTTNINNMFVPGVYTATFSATDSNGNTNSTQVLINVIQPSNNCGCLNFVLPTSMPKQ